MGGVHCTRLNIYFCHHFSKFFYIMSWKNQILYMNKIILHLCTPPISNLMVCWFQNSFFVLFVPTKLSWGNTSEVLVPQNGLNMLYPGMEQLCHHNQGPIGHKSWLYQAVLNCKINYRLSRQLQTVRVVTQCQDRCRLSRQLHTDN